MSQAQRLFTPVLCLEQLAPEMDREEHRMMQECITFLLSILTAPRVSVPGTIKPGSSCRMAILITCSSSPWTQLHFHNLQLVVTMNPTAFTVQEVVLFGLGAFWGLEVSFPPKFQL